MNDIQRNNAVQFGLAAARALNSGNPGLLGRWQAEFGLFHGQFERMSTALILCDFDAGVLDEARRSLPEAGFERRMTFHDQICTWAAAALSGNTPLAALLAKTAPKRREKVLEVRLLQSPAF